MMGLPWGICYMCIIDQDNHVVRRKGELHSRVYIEDVSGRSNSSYYFYSLIRTNLLLILLVHHIGSLVFGSLTILLPYCLKDFLVYIPSTY